MADGVAGEKQEPVFVSVFFDEVAGFGFVDDMDFGALVVAR